MNRRIVLIAVAVVLALFGTFAVYSYAHNADERAVAGGRAVKVLIAAKRVAAGTTWADAVKSGNLQEQNVPASSAPNSALTSTDDGVSANEVAQSDIAPGQIVLREAFGAVSAETGVLAVPKGQLAISVALGSDADVAGYVAPHSEVVIFATSTLKQPNNSTNKLATTGGDLSITRTVVPRASVLATSAAAPTNTVGKDSSSSNTGSVLVTLALSQADAERVIMAQHAGQLYLGLLTDSSAVTQDGGVLNAGVFHPTPIWVK